MQYDWDLSISLGDTIAILISLFALGFSIYTGNKQNELNDLQISKENRNIEKLKKADFSAELVKDGSNSHKIVVKNIGESEARNVRIADLSDGHYIIGSELRNKFPRQIIHSMESVHMVAALHMSSPRTMHFDIQWEDDNSKYNRKSFTLSF